MFKSTFEAYVRLFSETNYLYKVIRDEYYLFKFKRSSVVSEIFKDNYKKFIQLSNELYYCYLTLTRSDLKFSEEEQSALKKYDHLYWAVRTLLDDIKKNKKFIRCYEADKKNEMSL